MPKVSINLLTHNRSRFLESALLSIDRQTYRDFEVVVVNDGSSDNTPQVLASFEKKMPLRIIEHKTSLGITKSRQEALIASSGEYVAVLDDDDEWLDRNKLKLQIDFLEKHPRTVLVGGGIKIHSSHISILHSVDFHPSYDWVIRATMLLKNNFFNSTVMFRRDAAIKAGGFVSTDFDGAEDYHLWLRMGEMGRMHNFHKVFALYRKPNYTNERVRGFLQKQLWLMSKHKNQYPFEWLAWLYLRLRLLLT